MTMGKLLFILAVVGAVGAYLVIRYRRQVVLGIKIVKAIRSGMRGEMEGKARSAASVAEKLVQCVRCGAWVPSTRALSLRGSTAFCSAECAQNEAQ